MDDIKIWDTINKYSYKHYNFDAWADRALWQQIPYGTTNYNFIGDCTLEGPNFWISLHSSPFDAVLLYAKKDLIGTPTRHNEIYRAFDTSTGCRNYGEGSQRNTIIKNIQEEIIVESESFINSDCNEPTNVITRYRLLKDKQYFQVIPVSQASEQGFHGESRINLTLDINNPQDYVVDSMKQLGLVGQINFPASGSNMLLDFAMDADVIWTMSWPSPEKSKPFDIWHQGGDQAGWSDIGEGVASTVWASPFAYFAGEPITIGVINDNNQFRYSFWNFQPVKQYVSKDVDVKSWKINYTKSPLYGTDWFPGYAGTWKVIGLVDGVYITQVVNIIDTSTPIAFKMPQSGYLEHMICYLYDRNILTPPEIFTVAEIYRSTNVVNTGSAVNTGKQSGSVAAAVVVLVVAGIALYFTRRKFK